MAAQLLQSAYYVALAKGVDESRQKVAHDIAKKLAKGWLDDVARLLGQYAEEMCKWNDAWDEVTVWVQPPADPVSDNVLELTVCEMEVPLRAKGFRLKSVLRHVAPDATEIVLSVVRE